MKVLSDKTLKNGVRRVTVELAGDTSYKFAVIKDDAYYKLGGQVDDIVQGHVINECTNVYWCSVTQGWVDA